jgi:hypothetical protein
MRLDFFKTMLHHNLLQVVVGRMIVASNIQKPAKPTDPIKIDLSKEAAVYGKKVTIELLNNYLSLAEVEVWGKFLDRAFLIITIVMLSV